MTIFKNHEIVVALYTVCRILLGAVFVYASWDKILDPTTFADIIANYQIVSPRTIWNWFAAFVSLSTACPAAARCWLQA